MSLIASELQRQRDYMEGWNAAIQKAAEVAGDYHAHTGSVTTERDYAVRLCPRIARAILAWSNKPNHA